jgi:hypothetical protein
MGGLTIPAVEKSRLNFETVEAIDTAGDFQIICVVVADGSSQVRWVGVLCPHLLRCSLSKLSAFLKRHFLAFDL